MRRPGTLREHWLIGRTLLASYGGPALAVTLLEPGIARIRFAPTGAFASRRSWSPVPPDDAFDQPPVTVRTIDDAGGSTTGGAAGAVEINSDRLTVRVEPDAGRVTVLDRSSGQVLLSDGPDGGPAWDPSGPARAWTRRMPRDVHYFGLGERTGLLDKRGRRHTFWNTDRFEGVGPGTDELHKSIPFYLAMDGAGRCHGVYLNNTHRPRGTCPRTSPTGWWGCAWARYRWATGSPSSAGSKAWTRPQDAAGLGPSAPAPHPRAGTTGEPER